MSLKLVWNENMKFTAFTPSGHEVEIDAAEKSGGKDSAARPMELMLTALAGCSSMDVVSILKKMKSLPDAFRVEVEVERAPEHPKVYTAIHLKYILKGAVDRDKVQKAVELSQEKYCSASAMLKKASELTYEIIYED